MLEQKLSKWVNTGYPYVKEAAGLAPWIIPEHGFSRVTEETGDDAILEISQLLGLARGMEHQLDKAPDPISIPSSEWQDTVMQWQSLPQVAPVIAAFVEAANPVMLQLNTIKTKINPMIICRSLSVLLFAPFVDQGKALLDELTAMLGETSSSPDDLIRSYASAVKTGDISTLEKVNRCVVKSKSWHEWSLALQEQLLKYKSTPKLVSMTPPVSTDLINILATLMKEGNDGPSRNHPGHQGKQVATQ